MKRQLLTLLLLSLALPVAADQRSARLYVGGSTADAGAGPQEGFLIGYQSSALGKKVGSFWGMQMLAIGNSNDGAIPIFSVDGGLHFSFLPNATVRPYADLGLGASFLLILPFPSVRISVGAQIPVGEELKLDVGIEGRSIVDIFEGSEAPPVASTLYLGLGF